MSFKPEIVFQNIPGFTRETEDTRINGSNELTTNLGSLYEQKTDIELYGMKFRVSAYVNTDYIPATKKGKTATRIKNQSLYLRLVADTHYEGYEALPRHVAMVSASHGVDPKKDAYALKLLGLLAKKLGRGEVHDFYPGVSLIVPTKPPLANPLEAIAQFKEEVEAVAQEYAEGKKPLGDIEIPQWEVNANQVGRHVARIAGILERAHGGRLSMQDDPSEATTDYSGEIRRLGLRHFPVGEAVTETRVEAFESAILALLGITREQFSATPHVDRKDSFDVNIRCHTAEQVFRAATIHFPLGHIVENVDRTMFDKDINDIFPATRRTGGTDIPL